MSPELAGLAGIFVFAAAWELAGMRGGHTRATLPSWGRGADLRDRLAGRLEIDRRIVRAGVAERVSPRSFAGAKLTCGAAGALASLTVLPSAPGRLAPAVVFGIGAAGFVAPDAWAERLSRRRQAQIAAAMPDALDLVAVGVAAGRPPVSLFAEIAAGTAGPLAAELGQALAEIEVGADQGAALERLRARTGAPELGALAAALERSRRYGSPLAEQLHAQAVTLRAEERRRISERAARAAPKIQLVVAMVLVPSALLAIAAALVANSDALFAAI